MDTARNKQIPQGDPNSVGRVVIDNRGRNVWQWSDDQLDSTTIMLKRLDNSELALEPTRKLRRPEAAGTKTASGSERDAGQREKSRTPTRSGLQIEQTFNIKLGGGFDPYNRS